MVYSITAGGNTYVTCDTDFLASDGRYYGSANLYVCVNNYQQNVVRPYVVPGTNVLYVPSSGGGNAQYLTITSVNEYNNLPVKQLKSTLDFSLTTVLIISCLGVLALQLFRTLFRR